MSDARERARAAREALQQEREAAAAAGAVEPATGDLTEPVKVQLVVYAEGQIGLAVVDNPARAHEYARAVEGVVVELPVLADYRAAKEPSRRR